MAIAGAHSIEQSEQRAGTAVEAFHRGGIAGGNMWDEFRPAMRAAIEHARRLRSRAPRAFTQSSRPFQARSSASGLGL